MSALPLIVSRLCEEPQRSIQCVDEAGWASVLKRVHDDEPGAVVELYSRIQRGLMILLRRTLSRADAEDICHETFVTAVTAIKKQRIQTPDAFAGYLRTIAKRKSAAHWTRTKATLSFSDPDHPEREAYLVCNEPTPDVRFAQRQRDELALEVLRSMTARDRDILRRFYLDGQSQEQICVEMGLTATQFRLLKSRAKARFGEDGRKRMQPRREALRARRFAS